MGRFRERLVQYGIVTGVITGLAWLTGTAVNGTFHQSAINEMREVAANPETTQEHRVQLYQRVETLSDENFGSWIPFGTLFRQERYSIELRNQ